MNGNIRVVISEPIPAVQTGITMALAHDSEIEFSAIVNNIQDSIAIAKSKRASVVIADIPYSGDVVAASIRELLDIQIPVLAYSLNMRGEFASWLVNTVGVAGYIPKTAAIDEIRSAIRTVGRGGTYISPELAMSIMRTRASVSARQGEIVRMLCLGMTGKEIAGKLHLSAKTVDAHKLNLMRKLDIHNRAELIAWGMRSGYVDVMPQSGVQAG